MIVHFYKTFSIKQFYELVLSLQTVESIRVFINVGGFLRLISPLSHILSLNIRVANRVIIVNFRR